MKLTNLFGKTVQEIAAATLNSDIVRGMINARMERYASVRNIGISHEGVTVTLRMLGEDDAITVYASEVEIADDTSQIVMRGLSSDRPWLHNLMKNFMEGRAIPLPPEAAAGVEVLKPLLD